MNVIRMTKIAAYLITTLILCLSEALPARAFSTVQDEPHTVIYKPEGKGKHPAILFIPGFPCRAIKNYGMAYNQLIKGWREQGYIVMLVEKPGIDAQGNSAACNDTDLYDEVKTFERGLLKLKQLPEVDADQIFIFGHSMGGIIAPILSQKHQVKGVMVYGSPFRPWFEFATEMIRFQKPVTGTDYVTHEDDMRQLHHIMYRFFVLKQHPDTIAAADPQFKRILADEFQHVGGDQFWSRHYRYWQEIDELNLTKAWASCSANVLSIWGEYDFEIVNAEDHKRIVEIVNHYHPGKGTFLKLPKANHNFIEVEGMQAGVQQMNKRDPAYNEKHFSYKLLQETDAWMKKVMKHLPKPSGPFAVGTKTLEIVDQSRSDLYQPRSKRKLPLQVWYPTADTTAKSSPYIADAKLLKAMLDKHYNQLDSTSLAELANVTTYARLNAPVLNGRKFPLVLFSHGQGVSRQNYTAIATELASLGHLVIAVDHPYGGFTRLSDGRVLTSGMDTLLHRGDADQVYRSRMQDWSGDLTFVLDEVLRQNNTLGKQFKNAVDQNRIIAMGHSLGGNVAMKMPALDARVKGGINLDGGSFQNLDHDDLLAPTLVIRSQPLYSEEDLQKRGRSRETWKAMEKQVDSSFQNALRGARKAYELKVAGTGHMSFSDAAFVLPEMISRFGGDIIAADRGHEIIMKVITGFIKTCFLDQTAEQLKTEITSYPEVALALYGSETKH